MRKNNILEKIVRRCGNLDPELYTNVARNLPVIDSGTCSNSKGASRLGNSVRYNIRGYKHLLNYDLLYSFVQELCDAITNDSISISNLCYMELRNRFPVPPQFMSMLQRDLLGYYSKKRRLYFDAGDFAANDFGSSEFGDYDFGSTDFGTGDFGREDYEYEDSGEVGIGSGDFDYDDTDQDEEYDVIDENFEDDYDDADSGGADQIDENYDADESDDDETVPPPSGSNSYHYTYIYGGPWPWIWRPWGLFYYPGLRSRKNVYPQNSPKAVCTIKAELVDVKAVRNRLCLCYLVDVETEINNRQYFSSYYSKSKSFRMRGLYARSTQSHLMHSKYALELELTI